uniref:Uncharacterized protein n=1 Tax=Anguilla anguilla TaxID=7936 RepID=A0A0E9TT44_ANGAN
MVTIVSSKNWNPQCKIRCFCFGKYV